MVAKSITIHSCKEECKYRISYLLYKSNVFYFLSTTLSAYYCHGRWEDNGTHYLITTPSRRSSIGAGRFCFIYREQEDVVQFSSSSDSCQRNISPGIGGTLAFNVTSSGKCFNLSNKKQNMNYYTLLKYKIYKVSCCNIKIVAPSLVQKISQLLIQFCPYLHWPVTYSSS